MTQSLCKNLARSSTGYNTVSFVVEITKAIDKQRGY